MRRYFQNEDYAIAELLQACAKKKDLYKGTRLHADVLNRGLLERSPHVISSLMNMYIKCGDITRAEEVFYQLPLRDTVCWSTLIAGYAQQGQGIEAVRCYDQMLSEGVCPNAVTFTCILMACGIIRALRTGKQIHNEILARDLLKEDMILGTALVDMYVKCGMINKAQEVLHRLPVKYVGTWNAMITGLCEEGKYSEAITCFEQMLSEGISPNIVTFVCVLKACGRIKDIHKGKAIHDEIASKGLLEKDIMLGTALVDMYAKCGELQKAQEVQDMLPVRDTVSWNTMIAGFSQHGLNNEAFNCFKRLKMEGHYPDRVSFVCILKACGSKGTINKGKKIHCELATRFLVDNDVVLSTALVDMYAKCGLLSKAQEVLDGSPVRNVATWNAMISGYIQNDQCLEALNCYEQMQSEGLCPDEITLVCALKACGNLRSIEKGRQIHEEVSRKGLLVQNAIVGTALVDMYVKCGALAKAQEIIDTLPTRNAISLNSIIAGYAQQGLGQDALNCFELMQKEGLPPSAVTYACVLKACGITGAVEKGKQIHDEVVNMGLLKNNAVLGTALVDMYAKCGMLVKAQELLDGFPVRNVAMWNALIAGYAKEGQGHQALNCFEQMQTDGLLPDDLTFLCVLTAYSHSGLMDEAEKHFWNLSLKYGIVPKIEHHTCMVDILGSAGHFEKAVSFIKKMPNSHRPPLWLSLLGACRKWGNVQLGRTYFDEAILLDEHNSAYYVLMAKIYAAAGMQEDAEKVKHMRLRKTKVKRLERVP